MTSKPRGNKKEIETMNGTCDCCDHDPSATRASLRRTMAECDDCGRTLCEECLMEMAVEKGMTDALANGVAPRPLQPEDVEVSAGGSPAASNVRIISMSMTRWPCGSCAGEGKAIMTISEAARLLGVSKKRMEGIIYQEKVRLGRLPDFVGDAGGRIDRKVITGEFIAWIRSGQARRGRPPRGSR